MAPPRSVTDISEKFDSPLHDTRLAALLGMALGVSFFTCFATGMVSHLAQHPQSWIHLPPRPANLYRVTQGLHVITGIASIPMLLAKLWTVYPRFVEFPPVRGLAHAVERLTVLPLVAGSLFMLYSGVNNTARWYPWQFFFTTSHYEVAWITIGALVAHIGVKAATTRRVVFDRQEQIARSEAKRVAAVAPLSPSAVTYDELSDRRRFLITIGLTSAAITTFTAGQTIPALRRIAALAPRRVFEGPQRLPVNRTAAAAGVLATARDPRFAVRVTGKVARPLAVSLEQMRAMQQREAVLPIACVEGWSTSATWTGVPVRDLLRAAGARHGARVRVISLQTRGLYRDSILESDQSLDPDTLLALTLNGEELHLDHGFPVRLIAPNRPGVMQTKWVTELRVL